MRKIQYAGSFTGNGSDVTDNDSRNQYYHSYHHTLPGQCSTDHYCPVSEGIGFFFTRSEFILKPTQCIVKGLTMLKRKQPQEGNLFE